MPEGPSRLLIIRMSSLGDVVHALPVATALRRRLPQAHLAWLVRDSARDLLEGHPDLDEVIVLGAGEARPGVSVFPSRSALVRELRRRRFDVTLDLQGLLATSALAFLSGAPQRVGYRNCQEGAFIFNNRPLIPDRRDVHAVQGYLGFARWLGADPDPVTFRLPDFGAEEATVAQALQDAGGSLEARPLALVPGAKWLSKRWPAEHFARLARLLADAGETNLVVVGAEVDRPLAATILRESGVAVADLTGRTTLRQTTALLARCRLVVANDTGPMAIAAAVGTPIIALFGPTDPARTGPYGAGHTVLAAEGVACLRCRRRACGDMTCLRAITPKRVAAEVHRRTVCLSGR
jgi:lipopolysaccharide heptosyltransferase II